MATRLFADALTRTLLFDGGMGTSLLARGLDLQQMPPEAWLRDRPDDVRAVHAAFADAGADVLQTNSFGLLRLARAGTSPGDPADLAARSVRLAAGLGPLVVASLGPSGPPGADPGWLADHVERLAHAFADAGAHALHLETCCDPTELSALLRGAARGPLPLCVSMTVSLGQTGLETPLGVPLARMLRTVEESADLPAVIGVNCSLPARRQRRSVAELREWVDRLRVPQPPRVLVQPQIDEPAPDCKRPPIPETPARFAADLWTLHQDGADLLGGCCGCRPDHIAAARQTRDAARAAS